MLNYNVGYDPYDGSNKRQHLFELVMIIRRALTLKALYEKMIAIINFTCKRIIPHAIPALTYCTLTRGILHIHGPNIISGAVLTRCYGASASATLGIIGLTVLGLAEMTLLGICVMGQQYIFWWLFLRTPKKDSGRPPRPKPPRRRDIKF